VLRKNRHLNPLPRGEEENVPFSMADLACWVDWELFRTWEHRF
jgi:hypothetical protein